MENLEKLFESYEKLEVLVKPMIEKQKEIKLAIQNELDELKLDSYESGQVSATKMTKEVKTYPRKLVEEKIKDKDLLNEISIVRKSEYVTVRVRKDEDE